VALASDGSHLYAADQSTIRLLTGTAASGTVQTLTGAAPDTIAAVGPLPGTIDLPRGMTLLHSGDLLFTSEQAVMLLRIP
jgi:hypothetical protein